MNFMMLLFVSLSIRVPHHNLCAHFAYVRCFDSSSWWWIDWRYDRNCVDELERIKHNQSVNWESPLCRYRRKKKYPMTEYMRRSVVFNTTTSNVVKSYRRWRDEFTWCLDSDCYSTTEVNVFFFFFWCV